MRYLLNVDIQLVLKVKWWFMFCLHYCTELSRICTMSSYECEKMSKKYIQYSTIAIAIGKNIFVVYKWKSRYGGHLFSCIFLIASCIISSYDSFFHNFMFIQKSKPVKNRISTPPPATILLESSSTWHWYRTLII